MLNFSSHAEQVIALARREAARLNHDFVGTEHLLLGVVRLGHGGAANVLQKMGVELEAMRTKIEKLVGAGREVELVPAKIPYTPRVKKSLAFAGKEAEALNHFRVGTGHLLLGLLREGEGLAGHVLKGFGIDLERAREEVLKESQANPGAAEPTVRKKRSEPGDSLFARLRRFLFRR